jgi:hypothetical protein
MDLSIIIVNWNTKDLLAKCLDSIYQTVEGLAFEVLVVDNASTDGSAAMVRRRFPQVRLIENDENVGFARANNQAIRRARGRYVLLLNSDTEVVPGSIANMVTELETQPDVGITSVCLASPDGSPQFCYGSFPSLFAEFRSLFGLHRWDLSCWGKINAPREVDWVSGACLMARKAMLDEIGLLDEEFFMFGEEVDLCYRAKDAGWRICLVPSDPVVHVRAGSTGKTSKRLLRLYHGKLRYSRKHLGQVQTKLLLLMIQLSALGKLAFYGAFSLANPEYVPHRHLWTEVLAVILKGGLE